jgi:hypothetical protein
MPAGFDGVAVMSYMLELVTGCIFYPQLRTYSIPLPAEMLGIIGSTLNERPIVEPAEPLFQLIPDGIEAFRLCGERTASMLSFEKKPLIGKPWAIGVRHVPNPFHFLPSDRFSLSSGVFTGNLVFSNQ